MSFRVSFPGMIRNRLIRLREKLKGTDLSKELGSVLAEIQRCLEEHPLELGEIQFRLKHLPFPVCLLARRFLAINYAVDEANKNVMVTKLRMLDDHPFPAGFERILND